MTIGTSVKFTLAASYDTRVDVKAEFFSEMTDVLSPNASDLHSCVAICIVASPGHGTAGRTCISIEDQLLGDLLIVPIISELLVV